MHRPVLTQPNPGGEQRHHTSLDRPTIARERGRTTLLFHQFGHCFSFTVCAPTTGTERLPCSGGETTDTAEQHESATTPFPVGSMHPPAGCRSTRFGRAKPPGYGL